MNDLYDLYEKERREKLAAMQRHDAGIGGTIGMEQVDTCCNKIRTATNEEIQDNLIARAHKRLNYHPPTQDQLPRFVALRDAAKQFATAIVRNTPIHDQHTTLQLVEAALMHANKSIALEND